MGRAKFTVQCAPHYYHGKEDKQYRCLVTSDCSPFEPSSSGSSLGLLEANPMRSVVVQNGVYLSAEVFANSDDLLHLGFTGCDQVHCT